MYKANNNFLVINNRMLPRMILIVSTVCIAVTLLVVTLVVNPTDNSSQATCSGTVAFSNESSSIASWSTPTRVACSNPQFYAVTTCDANRAFQVISGCPPPCTNGFVYVPNSNGNTVSVIDIDTHEIVYNITVGMNPGMAIIREHLLFVVNSGNGTSNGTVSVINTATFRVVATIPVGIFPVFMAITNDGFFIYVTNTGFSIYDQTDYTTPVTDTVSVIDMKTMSVIHTIEVGANPTGVVISNDGKTAYVINSNFQPKYSNQIGIYNKSTNSVVINGTVYPRFIVVDGFLGNDDDMPGNTQNFTDGAPLQNVSVYTKGSISVIHTANYIVTSTVPYTDFFPVSLAVLNDELYIVSASQVAVLPITNTVPSPTHSFILTGENYAMITVFGNFAYVANEENNTVSVIAAGSYNVTTIPVGLSPDWIEIFENNLYVVNTGSNTVSVIDMANKNITSTFPVSNGAAGIVAYACNPTYMHFSIVHFTCSGSIFVGSIGNISIVDTASMTVNQSISVTGNVADITVIPAIRSIAVATTALLYMINPANTSLMTTTNYSSNNRFNVTSGSVLKEARFNPESTFAWLVFVQPASGALNVIIYDQATIFELQFTGTVTGSCIASDSSALYVGFASGKIAIIRIGTTTNKTLTNHSSTMINICVPVDIEADPLNTSNAYVLCTNGTVYILTKSGTLTVVGNTRLGHVNSYLSISPNGKYVYVLSDNVYIFELAARTKRTIAVGYNPTGLVFSPNGNYACVLNDVSVFVIDTVTYTVTTINIGDSLIDIAFSSDSLVAFVTNAAGISVISLMPISLVHFIFVGSNTNMITSNATCSIIHALYVPKGRIGESDLEPTVLGINALKKDYTADWVKGSGFTLATVPEGTEVFTSVPEEHTSNVAENNLQIRSAYFSAVQKTIHPLSAFSPAIPVDNPSRMDADLPAFSKVAVGFSLDTTDGTSFTKARERVQQIDVAEAITVLFTGLAEAQDPDITNDIAYLSYPAELD